MKRFTRKTGATGMRQEAPATPSTFTKCGLVLASLGVILGVGGLYLYVQRHIGWENLTQLEVLKTHLESYGMWGPVLYVALLTVAVVISHIPNVPLAIAAGMIFGPLWGGVYSLMGAVLGASIDFWLGRLLGRKVMQALVGKTMRFCDRCTGSFIGWIIFLTRLLPVFSFDVISYGAGLTNISFRVFLLATLAGAAPMTFVLTSLGDVIQVNPTMTLLLTSSVLLGLFLVPWLIRQYNVFGLRDRIIFE